MTRDSVVGPSFRVVTDVAPKRPFAGHLAWHDLQVYATEWYTRSSTARPIAASRP